MRGKDESTTQSKTRDDAQITLASGFRQKTPKSCVAPTSENFTKDGQTQGQQMVLDMNLDPVTLTAHPSDDNNMNGLSTGLETIPPSETTPDLSDLSCTQGNFETVQNIFDMPDAFLGECLPYEDVNDPEPRGIVADCAPVPSMFPIPNRNVESTSSSSSHHSEEVESFQRRRSTLLSPRARPWYEPHMQRAAFQMSSTSLPPLSHTRAFGREKLESKIDVAILSVIKLYESGVYLDLLHEDSRIQAELENLRSRLHRLIQADAK